MIAEGLVLGNFMLAAASHSPESANPIRASRNAPMSTWMPIVMMFTLGHARPGARDSHERSHDRETVAFGRTMPRSPSSFPPSRCHSSRHLQTYTPEFVRPSPPFLKRSGHCAHR
jgi:hypothetical protein